MRKLEPDETPQTGDWSYHFGYGWHQLSAKPMPFKEATIREQVNSHKTTHFPIVIVRPNFFERVFGVKPKVTPNQHRIRKTGSAF